MAVLTESGLRRLIKEELRKTLKEDTHQPEGLSKLVDFLKKLQSVNPQLHTDFSNIMQTNRIPPTDDVAFGDYGTGDLEVYTRKGGLIGRIPRDLAKNLGIVK